MIMTMPLILFPRVVGDPIHFPGFAAIVRERLFEMTGIRLNVGDDEPHENRPAIPRFLVEEFTTPIFELADGRLAQNPAFTVGKIQGPLVRLGIV